MARETNKQNLFHSILYVLKFPLAFTVPSLLASDTLKVFLPLNGSAGMLLMMMTWSGRNSGPSTGGRSSSYAIASTPGRYVSLCLFTALFITSLIVFTIL